MSEKKKMVVFEGKYSEFGYIAGFVDYPIEGTEFCEGDLLIPEDQESLWDHACHLEREFEEIDSHMISCHHEAREAFEKEVHTLPGYQPGTIEELISFYKAAIVLAEKLIEERSI
jgi:hypothetical protein